MTLKFSNIITTDNNFYYSYVEWSLHNPRDGIYDWSGMADIEKFIKLAQREGFYIILRPGPYICAERDNVGYMNLLKEI